MSDFIGAAISATASHINGLGSWFAKQHDSAREFERQKEFAQNGIRWRVEDAKAAGIHPIFALGANTPTYSPQAAVGHDFGLADAGQNIGRAIEAGMTRRERESAQAVQNAFYEAQIDNIHAQTEQHRAQTDAIKQGIINDALYNNTDFIRQSALASEDRIRHQQASKPIPETGTYDDLSSGIKPYVVGDTVMEFPPEDVADLMEDPKVLAIWKAAIEAAWHTDPKLREHFIKKLPKRMQEGIAKGTHELTRIPGYGLKYSVKPRPKPRTPIGSRHRGGPYSIY